MDNLVETLVAVGLIVAFGVGRIIWKKRQEPVRSADQASLAESLGFDFSPEERSAEWEHVVPMLYDGEHKKTKNRIIGRKDDVDVAIFDYEYSILRTSNHGPIRTTYEQTVISFASYKMNLPIFEMGPETLMQKLGAALGFKARQ